MKADFFKPRDPQSVVSIPNVLTLLRLLASLAFFVMAAVRKSPTDNLIGFGIHLIGDFIDGFAARKFGQETILGAEMDIISDRMEVLFFYVNFLNFNPGLFPAVTLYLVNYAFIDFYLSNQFQKFGLISPNYFGQVDRTVYILNFSPIGKFLNSTVIALLLIFLPRLQILAVILASGLIAIKLYSVRLLILKKRADLQRDVSCP